MIIDFQRGDAPQVFDCDVAVIGAGAVGIPLAAELSRRGIDVMLVEGGGEKIQSQAQSLNDVEVLERPMDGLKNARFRLLGGSTNFWGGQIVRFDSSTFQPRPWVGSDGWLVGREELNPYYDRAAQLMGLSSDFSDGELWRRARAKPPDFGSDIETFFTRCLVNRSTANLFRDDLGGPRLRTLIHANAVSLESSDSGARVSGLNIRSLSGRSGRISARRVVLACGTVEISRLLLSPLTGGHAPSWSRNPWVGRGFIDHLDVVAATVRLIDPKKFHATFDNLYVDGLKYFPRVKLSRDAQEVAGSLEVAGRFEFRSNYKEHLDNLKLFVRSLMSGRMPSNISQVPSHLSAVWSVSAPLIWRYISSRRAFNPSDGGIELAVMSEQWPIRESAITLRDGLNSVGARNIGVSWKLDGREIESIAFFAETVADKMREAGLAELSIPPLLSARDPRFLQGVRDYYHQMGGARMGRSAADGVVDVDLKVFGTENLFVAGAAVFPFSGFGNPTYTAMALGLRLGDHLVGGKG